MDISTPSTEAKAELPQNKLCSLLCRATCDSDVKSTHAALQANLASP